MVDTQSGLSALLQGPRDGDAQGSLHIHGLISVDTRRMVFMDLRRAPFEQEPLISRGIFKDACREILSLPGSADQEPTDSPRWQSEGDEFVAARTGQAARGEMI